MLYIRRLHGMGQDLHIKRIDELLRDISELENKLMSEHCELERTRISKSLKARQKRLEFLIPYPFRRELTILCQKAGIDASFA